MTDKKLNSQENPVIKKTHLHSDKDGYAAISESNNERHNLGNSEDRGSTSNSLEILTSKGFSANFVVRNSYIDMGDGNDELNFENLANTGNHLHGEKGEDTLRIPMLNSDRLNYTFQKLEDGSFRATYSKDGKTYTNTFESFEKLTIGSVGSREGDVTVSVKDLGEKLNTAGVGKTITAEEVVNLLPKIQNQSVEQTR